MILGKFCLMFGIIENVLRSTLSYPNETSKECIQFLSDQHFSTNNQKKNIDVYNYSLKDHKYPECFFVIVWKNVFLENLITLPCIGIIQD